MSAYDEKYYVIFKPIQTDAFKTLQQFVKTSSIIINYKALPWG